MELNPSYRKFQVALAAAVVAAIPLAADGRITLVEGLSIAAAFLGAGSVAAVTNK